MYSPKLILKMLFVCAALVIFAGAAHLQAQNPPVLTYPDNGNNCQSLNVKFEWEASQDAISYTVEIANSSTFTQYQSYDVGASTTFSQLFTDYNKTYYWRVRALFPGTSVISQVWHFTTKKAPPVKDEPFDGDICVSKTFTMEWQPVVSATNYKIQVSTSNTFNPLLINATVNSLTYTATFPENNKQYFWRVSASLTECETEWSPVWSFTTKPPQPVKILPDNNENGIAIGTNYLWERPVGVPLTTPITYNFTVSRNQAFTNIVVSAANLTANSYSSTTTLLQYNTTYYWRVGGNIPGCSIDWTDYYSFKTQYVAPVLNAPANNSICVVLSPNLTWSASTGATAYTLQVSTLPDFSELTYNETNITNTFFKLNDLEPMTNYYWRVMADDANNNSQWSPVYSFVTTIAYPEQQYPEDHASGVGIDIDFLWGEPAPNSYYRFQLSNSTDFSMPMEDIAGLSGPTYSVTGLDYNTSYYWRVSASYTTCSSTWSPVFTFKTTLAKPSLIMPANNEEKVSLSPTFVWTMVPGATKYDIDIALDEDFDNIVTGRRGIPSNSVTIPGLEQKTKFYWRVRALNEETMSFWTDPYSFTTTVQGAGIPVLVTPISGSIMQPVSGTVTWEVAPRAKTYQIQISETNDFSAVVATQDGLTSAFFEYLNFEHYKTYFWRVRSLNDSGYTAWSVIWNFRVIALAPDQVISQWTPADNLKRAPLNIPFSWYPIDRIDGYHLQIAKDEDFNMGSMFFNDNKVWKSPKNIFELEENTTYYWRVRGWNEAGSSPWSDTWEFTTDIFSSVNGGDYSVFKTTVSPNPFKDKVKISFTLTEPTPVTIKVLDATGREIITLMNGEIRSGENSVEWSASGLPSGLYFYTLSTNKLTEAGRLVLVK